MSLRRHLAILVGAALLACGSGAGEETKQSGRGDAAATTAVADGLETLVLTVPSMSCELCVRAIEARLEEAGLRDIRVDLETKRVTAAFDPSRTSAAEVEALVEGEGFPVTESRLGDERDEGGEGEEGGGADEDEAGDEDETER